MLQRLMHELKLKLAARQRVAPGAPRGIIGRLLPPAHRSWRCWSKRLLSELLALELVSLKRRQPLLELQLGWTLLHHHVRRCHWGNKAHGSSAGGGFRSVSAW